MNEPTDPVDPLPPSDFAPFADLIPFARPIAFATELKPQPPVHEILLPSSTMGGTWADIGLVIAALLTIEVVIGVVLVFVMGIPFLAEPEEAVSALEREMLLPMLGVRAALVCIVIAIVLRLRRQGPRSIGMTTASVGINSLIGVGAIAVVYGVLLFCAMIVALLWPEWMQQMEENSELIMDLIPPLHPLGFAGMAAVVGIYEEVLFRGFLMTRLRRGTGSWTLAVLISTAVFTALHALEQTIGAVICVAFLSLAFSFLTIWRRSLVPAIVAHALFDFSQLLLLRLTAGETWT